MISYSGLIHDVFCVEQRMLPRSQLTALAGRVVEEEGGCNSMLVQGWNNTQLSISCVLQLVLYYSVYDVKSDLVDL